MTTIVRVIQSVEERERGGAGLCKSGLAQDRGTSSAGNVLGATASAVCREDRE